MACIEVVAGILWREGKYLATQRPAHKVHGGYWEFPGGKVEAGESLEEALQRELKEELGLDIGTDQEQCRFWKTVEHHYPERHVRVHFFHVQHCTGQPCGLEGQNIQWCLPEQGLHMPFLEADTQLVRELCVYVPDSKA